MAVRMSALAFARSVAKKAPADSEVHLLAVVAHMRASRYASNGERMSREYFQNNREAWEDIHSAFTDYLPLHPASYHWQLQYAKLAAFCGQWGEANRIFSSLPMETYDSEVFPDRREQEEFTARAAREVANATAKPALSR